MINKDTHTRFWVTLTNEDYEKLSGKAKEMNLSVTAFAGQIIAEALNKGQTKATSTKSPAELNNIVTAALFRKSVGEEFTIRGLFNEDDWMTMSRSEKAVAAKILAAIERNSDDLEICDVVNKTSVYRKNR
ncbi:MAG: hypothetical protein MR945_04520 [Agathobacter sp.]|nr:hypothetical protein [Agathobacter sp.]